MVSTDERAERAREAVKKAGGLVTTGSLAERWEVSRTRIYQLTQRDDFPQPIEVEHVGRVWLWDEVNAWREGRRRR